MDELIFRVLKQLATAEEVEAVRVWRQASHVNERRYRRLLEILSLTTRAEESLPQPAPPPVAEIIRSAQAQWPRRGIRQLQRSWLIPLGAAALVLLGFMG